jgi:hypothetical protein
MELNYLVDAPAHLIFLGIAKAVFQLVVAWLSRKYCLAPFCRHVGGYLEDIKSLCLAWRTALPFEKGGLGGTVGENMICLARLPTWFFKT